MRKRILGRPPLSARGTKELRAHLREIDARMRKIEEACELYALKTYVDQMFARISELEANAEAR